MEYENGLELLLAHMDIEDIITATETLYQLEGEGGSSLEEAMDENEEAVDTVVECGQAAAGVGGVRYGTVTDLLSFVNLLSNSQAAALQRLPEEMGVLLSKVSDLCPFRLVTRKTD